MISARSTLRGNRHVTVALWLALVLLAGVCVPGSAEERTTITYLYNWYAEDIVEDAFMEIIAEFERQNPDIRVETLRGGGGHERLRAILAGGNVPDIMHFERQSTIEYWKLGVLEPLDRYVADLDVRNQFVPPLLREVEFEGDLYAVPWDTDLRGLYWNIDLLEQSGLDGLEGPRNFAELDEYIDKLTLVDGNGDVTQGGLVPWGGNWYPPGWFWSFGGEIFDYEDLEPTVTHPKNIEAFEWMVELVDRFGLEQLNAVGNENAFYTGRLAMMVHATIFPPLIAAANPDLRWTTGLVPHKPEGRNGVWAGGMSHVMTRQSNNKEAAGRLLRYLSSPETQVHWYRLTQRLPTNLAAVAEISPDLDPRVRVHMNTFEEINPLPPLWVMILVRAGLLPAQSEVITKQKTPLQALQDVQRVAAAEYASFFGE